MEYEDDSYCSSEDWYNNKNRVVQGILDEKAIAICDASVKGHITLASDYIASNYWSDNVLASAESLVLVNLMYFIYNIAKNVMRGLITIYTD